jgi:NitT/TauT family transport system substrate-binding protein
LGLLLIPALLAGCSGSDDPPAEGTETIRLGVMVDSPAAYAAAYGTAEGIWAKHGLTVDSSTFSMGIETLDAIALGQKDLGGAADFAAVNRFGGAADNQLRLFAVETTSKVNAWAFWAKDDSVDALTDLEGQKVVTQLGTVVEYWLAVALTDAGVDLDSVEFVPADSPMAAVALLQNGSASAAILNAVASKEAANIDGAHEFATFDGLLPPTLSLGIASASYLADHADAVQKYLEAQGEIFAAFEADPDAAAAVIAEELNAPVDPIAVNIKNTNFHLDLTPAEVGTMKSIYQWGVDNGKVKNEYDLDDYIVAGPLKAAAPDKVTY